MLRFPVLCFLAILMTCASARAGEPVLRVGDVLTLGFPGEAAFGEDFRIDREGRVALPEVGGLAVSGLPLSEARDAMKRALSAAFRDSENLTVAVKQRRLMVTVLGYVRQPGPVELPDRASVEEAINAAGGLIPGAQLNRLQLRRGSDVVTFDFKKYLDTGDLSLSPRLEPLDILFVPASPLTGNVQVDFDARTLTAAGDADDEGQSVKVFGEVNRPGSFSYKPDSTVVDLLMRAGGVTRYAGVEQIRVINDGAPVLFNLKRYLDTGDANLLPNLAPGDTVFVPQEVDGIKGGARSIYILGAVVKPGSFEVSGATTLLDVLSAAGGPTSEADTAHIQILTTLDGRSATPTVFDLTEFIKNGGALDRIPKVNAGDTIVVPALPDDPTDNKARWTRQPTERSIYVFGQVGAPGRYAFDESLDFLDILSAADGPTDNADLRNIRISHRGEPSARVTRLDLTVYFETGDESLLPRVRPRDVIYIPEKNRQWLHESKESTVRVLGAIGAPGRYRFDDTMTILDLLAEAGGPTSDAYQEKIIVVNVTRSAPVARTFDLVAFAKNGDFAALPVLRAGDTVYLPTEDQRPWVMFASGLRDAVSVLSLIALFGAL